MRSNPGNIASQPCIASVTERHPHRMCVGGSIPSAWVMEDMRMNGLKDYQPQTEALRNFGIDVSKEAVKKYILENLCRLPPKVEKIHWRIFSKIKMAKMN